MMNNNTEEPYTIPILINNLAQHFSDGDSELLSILQENSLNFLSYSTHNIFYSVDDEMYIVKNLKEHLELINKDADTVHQFDCLHKKLKNQMILVHRCSMLDLFLNLLLIKTDTHGKPSWRPFDIVSVSSLHSASNSTASTKSSANDSLHLSSEKLEIFGPDLKSVYSSPSGSSIDLQFQDLKYHSTPVSSPGSPKLSPNTHLMRNLRVTNKILISEKELVQEIIFAFQGIEGKVLRKEPGTGGFIIDTRICISKDQRCIVLRLAELGFLHNQVKSYCDNIDNRFGNIGQCFVSALQSELSEHYALIAELQNNMETNIIENELTLRRLLVWARKPFYRIALLADIITECQDKKGGALISSVFSFMNHGSPDRKLTAQRILKTICTPLLRVLTRWLLDGLLEDPCNEFFIESRPVSKSELLWHDKYHLRPNMIPGFITPYQARQILVTGKSINFLRDVCNDVTNIVGKDTIQKTFENMNVEALFVPELNLQYRKALENAYRSTSQRVLDIMRGENRLIQHIQAFRRFLLLGQGDFIQILMELLAPELSKPATQIYAHTLSGILDNAIRSSNAQFEEEDILNRLDIRLMEVSRGDSGWDVFTMLYHVDGPIGTLFEPTLECYRTLFAALWKAKRMEYVLSGIWNREITSSKTFRVLPEISSIMQPIHILTSEMVHFIQQTQYYFLFEVLECSWVEMLEKLNAAETFDDIISAHDTFLDRVQYGVLLDPVSQKLHTQLCTIYNTILKLKCIEESLYSRSTYELEQMKAYNKKIEHGSLQDGFSITNADELKRVEQCKKFSNYLQSIKTQVRSLAKQYNDYVRKYLRMLASHSNVSLQLLSVRLDFNSYYERQEYNTQEFPGSFRRRSYK